MRVLTVYAHNNPHSFCHALMCRFTEGLVDAGHTSEVVDLYAIGFDPVLRGRDTPGWIDDSVPDDVLEHMNVRRSMLEQAPTPLRKWMVKRWMGDLDARGIVRKVRAMGCPPDVFPFGAQYGYSGKGTDTFLYKYRLEDPEVQIALKAALPVSRLHKRIGQQEMVHFKILSEDGYVQESAFADGTRVAANFCQDFVGSEKGIDHKIVPGAGVLPPEGWRVD